MANITLKDSGYPSVIPSGTQFSGNDIVNSGNEVELKGVNINYQRGSNVSAQSQSGVYEDVESNYTSTKNPSIQISGILKRGKASYSVDGGGTKTYTYGGTDLDQLPYLDAFCTTKGIKCLYYNDDVVDTTGYPIFTKFLGVTDAYDGHPTEKHIHVRCKSLQLTTSGGDGEYRFTLSLEVAG